MADSFIQMPPDSTGKLLDTSSLTVNSQTVQRERIVIADPTNATSLTAVKAASTAAAAADPALVVSLSPNSSLPAGTNVLGHVIVDSFGSSVAVTQSTSPWVTQDKADVAGGGTTAPAQVMMVGGKTNDGTPQYDIMPLGAGGRSVIIEGFAGGTAVTVSGTVSVTNFANPLPVSQNGSPWGIIGTTADASTTEVAILVVGGETNDATAQYQPIPLGPAGRSIIVEGTGAVASSAVGNPVYVAGVNFSSVLRSLPVYQGGTDTVPGSTNVVVVGGADLSTGKAQGLIFNSGGLAVATGNVSPSQSGFNNAFISGITNASGAPTPVMVAAYVYDNISSNTWHHLSDCGVAGSIGVGGVVASGSLAAGNPVLIAGIDGSSNVQDIPVAVTGAASPSQTLVVGGVFNSKQPAVASGSAVQFQTTSAGALIIASGTDTIHVTDDSTGDVDMLNLILKNLILLNRNIASTIPGADATTEFVDTGV